MVPLGVGGERRVGIRRKHKRLSGVRTTSYFLAWMMLYTWQQIAELKFLCTFLIKCMFYDKKDETTKQKERLVFDIKMKGLVGPSL